MINSLTENGMPFEPTYKTKRGIILMRRKEHLLYISGHGPENQITGKPIYSGRIGKELNREEGYLAARECGIIILGAVKAFGMVNCDGDFQDLDGVMDGFSDLMTEVLEERGYHARTVMGTHNLPNGNIPVEIETIIAVRDCIWN